MKDTAVMGSRSWESSGLRMVSGLGDGLERGDIRGLSKAYDNGIVFTGDEVARNRRGEGWLQQEGWMASADERCRVGNIRSEDAYSG